MNEHMQVPTTGTESGRVFRWLDWSAFAVATLVAFAGYCYTLAPTVTLEDSGELSTAGAYMGVPHPPGYPLWSFTCWIFTQVFASVTYMGQPNPAWAIALASAFWGALAAGLTALLICRSGSDILSAVTRDSKLPRCPKTERLICWVGAIASSLVFAFSPVNWSQSVIAEVYSLNAFFLALVFLLAYVWLKHPTDRMLLVLSFCFGLALTNYYALLLIMPALMILVLFKDMALFRDFVIGAIPFGYAYACISNMGESLGPLGVFFPSLPAIDHPTSAVCFVYLLLNFLAILIIYFTLPRGKTVALCLLGFELGLAFYVYMPLASETNPPMNWGYPRTWEGFLHAVSRGQYEKLTPTPVFSKQFVDQVFDYFQDLRTQFSLAAAIFGLIPFAAIALKIGRTRISLVRVTVALAALVSGLVFLEELVFKQNLDNPYMARTYMGLVVAILIMGVFGVMFMTLSIGRDLLKILIGKKQAPISHRAMIALVFAGTAFVYLLFLVKGFGAIREMNASSTDGITWSILSADIAMLALMILPAACTAIAFWAMREDTIDLDTTYNDVGKRWLLVTLLGFITMSVMLMVMASPKGDVQDMFIQRVKFISSHAFYSYWVGYGLMIAVLAADQFVRRFMPYVSGGRYTRSASVATRFAGTVFVLMIPLIPVYYNYHNKEQIRLVGGAEQNGHDFGWQFGNYQLRGADAILEELHDGEEPPPNPLFPVEMGTNAVFYGGTDPGRFVPTYMIYSARVRDDVYLITQNALADTTYMQVMRDLYGDRIWIPSQTDSMLAFQRYVEEVQSGRRPPNADLKIEGGRVQVSGALGVMEINGILAQMIFEHNNYRHPFFVEESYVIRWMYPYLEPHGLIMKINRDPIQLSAAMIQNDTDFWDWYTRRLIDDEMFTRDIVARKSFSKLRSAIAGVYAYSRMYPLAENAFQQGRLLYPLSPESSFRIAQEVYLPQQRLSDSIMLMTDFQKMDPGNTSVRGFSEQLQRYQSSLDRIKVLESLTAAGKLDLDSALELADLYTGLGQTAQFNSLCDQLLADPKADPSVQFRIAMLASRSGNNALVVKALNLCVDRIPDNVAPDTFLEMYRMYVLATDLEQAKKALGFYIARVPNNPAVYQELAALLITSGQTNDAWAAAQKAITHGGEQARQQLISDTRLTALHESIMRYQPRQFVLPKVY